MTGRLGIVGVGAMGSALLQGIIRSKTLPPSRCLVFDVDRLRAKRVAKGHGVCATASLSILAEGADALLLCVKPGQMEGVLKTLAAHKRKLVLTIAAGLPLAFYERRLKGWPLIRVMPNTPAQVGAGVSAFCVNAHCTAKDAKFAAQLLASVGEVVQVGEKEMDAVTALSGSGPGFICLFLEAFTDAGIRLGLTAEVARMLAVQTLLGTGLLAKQSGEHPAVLRERVSSPGGTTIEGLSVLERGGVRGLVHEALFAAKKKSEEIARSLGAE